MAIKHYTASLLLLLFSVPAVAGPYIGFGLGLNSGDDVVAPPPVTATHPVSSTSEELDDDGTGPAFSVGYRWGSWYTEASYVDLGTLAHRLVQSGEGVTFANITTNSREEDADTVALKIGRLFPVGVVSLYAEAGAHWYERRTSFSVVHSQTELAGDDPETTTNTLSASASSEHDSDVMYGVGVLYMRNSAGIRLGVSQYDGIDRTRVGITFLVEL